MKSLKAVAPWQAAVVVFFCSSVALVLLNVFAETKDIFVERTVFTALLLASAAALGIPVGKFVYTVLKLAERFSQDQGIDADHDPNRQTGKRHVESDFSLSHFNLPPELTEQEKQLLVLAHAVFRKQDIDLERSRRLTRLYDLVEKVIDWKMSLEEDGIPEDKLPGRHLSPPA